MSDHPPGGLAGTNCGVAAADEDDDNYSDGKITQHAVETLRNASRNLKLTAQPFFVAVGIHRPHLPWITPKKVSGLIQFVARDPGQILTRVGSHCVCLGHHHPDHMRLSMRTAPGALRAQLHIL